MVESIVTTRPRLTWWQTLRHWFKAIITHWTVTKALKRHRRGYPQFWDGYAATRIFSTAARPKLEVRIFAPPSSEEGRNSLFFLIHGGSWLYGSPEMDDEQAHLLANKYGFCVMSLQYSLSPWHRHPVPLHDLEAEISCILGDKDLLEEFHIDDSKIAVGGFSAGGSMTLAIAQLPSLRQRIGALVSIYPLTDWTGNTRQDTGPTAWGRPNDGLDKKPYLSGYYLPAGQSLVDPLVSAMFATREQIPQPLFMVTAEKDNLCFEGSITARKLAGLGTGTEVDVTQPWSANGVRYACARDMRHCYLHFWERIGANAEWEAKRQEVVERTWADVASWTHEQLDRRDDTKID